jgi:hypothetical protein
MSTQAVVKLLTACVLFFAGSRPRDGSHAQRLATLETKSGLLVHGRDAALALTRARRLESGVQWDPKTTYAHRIIRDHIRTKVLRPLGCRACPTIIFSSMGRP